MNAFRPSVIRMASIALGLALLPVAAHAADGMTAQDLAGRLSALQQDGTSFVRLKMEVKPGRATYQLQIKQRRGSSASDVMYQVLFPREQKGESIILHSSGGRGPSGTLFTPSGKSQALDASRMKDALLESDLAYADVIENFFAWPRQTLGGAEDVNGTSCQILESKPGKGDSSIYGSVKTWIDLRHMVPMRIEKYSTSGKLTRTITTTNVESDDKGRSLPAGLVVKRAGSDTSTVVEGSRIKHDVALSDADFTSEGAKNLSSPR